MVYFDISKINTLFKKSLLFNINKPSLISFYRADYHGKNDESLDESVRKTIFNKTGTIITGPIRILTHLRYFGYCFNPVSFYYCFDESDNKIDLIMAEVTNTPWKERHQYFISKKDKSNNHLFSNMGKEFHVSPFWDMDHEYQWNFSNPKEKLDVRMKNLKNSKKVFDVNLSLKRKPLTNRNLFVRVCSFPFITIWIVFKIHWQAVKLWIKGANFYIHPNKR